MANDKQHNTPSNTSPKKHGALYDKDTKHVESQDDISKISEKACEGSSEEE